MQTSQELAFTGGGLDPNIMSNPDLEPRLYVACLASYNAGTLYGEWIDAACEVEELRDEIQLMLERSPIPRAEEWAIHDHEGFSPLSPGEHEDLEQVSEAAKLIAEFGALAAHVQEDVGGFGYHETARMALEELYIGAYDSVGDWVEGLLDEGCYGPINETLRAYIDSDRLARDLELAGDVQLFPLNGQTHLFWSH